MSKSNTKPAMITTLPISGKKLPNVGFFFETSSVKKIETKPATKQPIKMNGILTAAPAPW